MPEQLTEQERLFGIREESYGTFTIENARLYPFIRLQRALVDEAKLRFTDDGLSVRAVDPANVGMVSATLTCDHGLGTVTAGTNVKRLMGILANKPRDLTLDIDIAYPWGTVRIEDDGWRVTERFGFTDPDSIRQEPDLPTIDYDATAEVPVGRVASFLNKTRNDYPEVELSAPDGTLQIAERGDSTEYVILAETDIDVDGEGMSFYSGDYLIDMVNAMNQVSVSTATFEWSEEFPVRITFETDDIEGEYLLAPRVKG